MYSSVDNVTQCNERSTDSIRQEIKAMFPIDNNKVPDSEKELHYDILTKHADIISTGPDDIGYMAGVKHHIETDSAYPVKIPLRRMAPVKRQIINMRSQL